MGLNLVLGEDGVNVVVIVEVHRVVSRVTTRLKSIAQIIAVENNNFFVKFIFKSQRLSRTVGALLHI